MMVEPTAIAGVCILRPRIHPDPRGHFLELWQQRRYHDAGITCTFVQDNISVSHRGVIRGLHAQQQPHAQAKLVTVLHGRAFDVVVDARAGSPSYGQWVGVELSGESGTQLFIPEGCLHGFQALDNDTVLHYKCSAPYTPAAEVTVRWDDPALGINWPVSDAVVSTKDAAGVAFPVMCWTEARAAF